MVPDRLDEDYQNEDDDDNDTDSDTDTDTDNHNCDNDKNSNNDKQKQKQKQKHKQNERQRKVSERMLALQRLVQNNAVIGIIRTHPNVLPTDGAVGSSGVGGRGRGAVYSAGKSSRLLGDVDGKDIGKSNRSKRKGRYDKEEVDEGDEDDEEGEGVGEGDKEDMVDSLDDESLSDSESAIATSLSISELPDAMVLEKTLRTRAGRLTRRQVRDHSHITYICI